MKVVLDSNVLVSAFATRGLCADVLRVVLAEHELVTTRQILEEVTRVLTRKLRVPRDTVEHVRGMLLEYATAAAPDPKLRLAVRDPDDAVILATAIAAGADVLVTGDRDLLDAPVGAVGIRIVDPRGFQRLAVRKG